MTPGERRLAQRLQEKLEDDYLIWYDVPIGDRRLHPDFIILHPSQGLTVLEVKDWKLNTIRQITPDTVTILTPEGEKTVDHPLKQARRYALAAVELLEKDELLIQQNGRHRGKLAFPYSYGAVLTNITRRQFESIEGLSAVFEPNLVICQDEMRESVEAAQFKQSLWNLCTYNFGNLLTPAQIDRVRWWLFPDIRIPDRQLSLPVDSSLQGSTQSVPNIIHIMDIQQEQLARSLGDGHRVIHGVAGSGKTMILLYRCLHLAQQISKPILVLCFNVALATKLQQLLQEKGMGDRIVVRNFHRWCSDLIQTYRIDKLREDQSDGNDELVQRVILAVDAGKISIGQYGAVLIDEGHDFKPSWLNLVAKMVDPQTRSLLLLYDDAQSIYERKQRPRFTFKSVGIQAQGRTTILKLNYRNTQELLTVAYEFARELLISNESTEDDTPLLIQPESAGRHGPVPQLICRSNFEQEVVYLAEQAQQLNKQGVFWNEIAIIYRVKWMAERIARYFKQIHIPIEWITEGKSSRNYRPTEKSIKLITMHSSKGLEFPIVFVPGIGYLPDPKSTPEGEARLLYVAMTRAVDQLIMTCDRTSEFVQKIERALEKV